MPIPEENTPDLKAIATHFHAILEAAVDGIVVIRDDGTIERVNRATEKIFAYSSEEIVGKNVSVLMPEPDRSRHDQYISNFLSTRSSKIIGVGREVVGQKKDGTTFPMHLSIGEAVDGPTTRFVGLIRDLSERQQLVNRLSATEQEFQLVFNKAPIGVLICNQTGEILRTNPWLCEYLDFEEKEIVGRPLESFIFPTHRESFNVAVDRLVKQLDVSLDLDLSLIGNLDDPKAVQIRGNTLLQTADSESLLFLVSDRSAELARQLTVMEARDNLAHSDRLHSLGEMASAIAHEINQPLAAINAYAQASSRILEQPVIAGEQIAETLKKISGQAERGGEIIRRIRGFAAKGQNTKTHEDVNELVRAATQFTQFSMDAEDIKLTERFSMDLPTIFIDRLQIQQVCINLIRNAVDAMARVEQGKKTMTITSDLDAGSVIVRFTDSGCGVPEDIRQHLFQPFQSSKAGGLGLGLAISHKIIADHNGKLEYQALETGGSMFSFFLPANKQ